MAEDLRRLPGASRHRRTGVAFANAVAVAYVQGGSSGGPYSFTHYMFLQIIRKSLAIASCSH